MSDKRQIDKVAKKIIKEVTIYEGDDGKTVFKTTYPFSETIAVLDCYKHMLLCQKIK